MERGQHRWPTITKLHLPGTCIHKWQHSAVLCFHAFDLWEYISTTPLGTTTCLFSSFVPLVQ